MTAQTPTKDPYDFWLKDEKGWKKAVQNNCTSGYGFTPIIAAALWMLHMQAKITDGAKVADVAAATFRTVDDGLGQWGLTGFQYGLVVSLLSQVWEHGEELRVWHNLDTQIGTEGEKANAEGGVLNPAILTVAPK